MAADFRSRESPSIFSVDKITLYLGVGYITRHRAIIILEENAGYLTYGQSVILRCLAIGHRGPIALLCLFTNIGDGSYVSMEGGCILAGILLGRATVPDVLFSVSPFQGRAETPGRKVQADKIESIGLSQAEVLPEGGGRVIII